MRVVILSVVSRSYVRKDQVRAFNHSMTCVSMESKPDVLEGRRGWNVQYYELNDVQVAMIDTHPLPAIYEIAPAMQDGFGGTVRNVLTGMVFVAEIALAS